MTIPKRLKAERERLNLSQPQLGELVGAGKTTVINWEKGASAPDAVQLSAIAAAGADVLYILTGERSTPVESTLTPREIALLDNYKHSGREGQRAIERVAMLEAKQPDLSVKKSERKAA